MNWAMTWENNLHCWQVEVKSALCEHSKLLIPNVNWAWAAPQFVHSLLKTWACKGHEYLKAHRKMIKFRNCQNIFLLMHALLLMLKSSVFSVQHSSPKQRKHNLCIDVWAHITRKTTQIRSLRIETIFTTQLIPSCTGLGGKKPQQKPWIKLTKWVFPYRFQG